MRDDVLQGTETFSQHIIKRALLDRRGLIFVVFLNNKALYPLIFLSTTFNLSVTLYTDLFICDRLRQRSIERVMDLTDSFTWEDLPTRDAETGHLTAAGWIPLIQMYTVRAAVVALAFHCVQSTIRIVTNHETMYITWYPFDWTVSPFYEMVNISQVTLHVCYKIKISSKYSTLFLT